MSYHPENHSLAYWARELGLHPNCPARWRDDGIVGVDGDRHYLEAFKVGGRWRVSREAMERFLAALNARPGGSTAAGPRTPAEARRADDRAKAELSAIGI